MDFPTTHWTLLAQASLNGDTTANKALESFCQRYREPIVKLLRWKGIIENRVEDMTHDFFLELMQHSSLKRANPESGRFRNFLCGALGNFLSNDARRNQSQKRGGGNELLSLDAESQLGTDLVSGQGDAELVLDREWAIHLITRSLARVAEQWQGPQKAARFAVLRAFLPGATEVISQADAAQKLGISEVACRSELHRLRESFRTTVREEVAATVSSPHETDDEMRHLLQVLQTCPQNFLQQTKLNS
jgi:DNA-directed RNA polymerase specialized sigma24 family protein